jgi:CDP-Glycerol:Poly(glycerophosphate) glycerophosphotransferase
VIDCYVSRRHYLSHVAPVWGALPSEQRGTLYVGGRLVGDAAVQVLGAISKNMTLLSPGPRVLVASQMDYQQVAQRRRVVYMQHGSGQSYGGDPDPAVNRAASYAGGDNQDRTDLFLMPGPHPAQRCRERYPHIPVEEIGCPALDRWLNDPPLAAKEPLIALAWHWENNSLCPESRTALPHFRSALPGLMDRYAVIGHGHPRAKGLAESVYAPLGIPWVDYETVMTFASVLVTDNSSIGWEFMATGRPVVWLTPPWYRRDVDHGLRFGPAFKAQGHVEVESPEDLLGAVESVLTSPPVMDLSGVYSHLDGRSLERAAAAIVALDEPAMTLAEVIS